MVTNVLEEVPLKSEEEGNNFLHIVCTSLLDYTLP